MIPKCLVFLYILVFLNITGRIALAGQPVNVIFDTDISSDVDDVGAVAVLHALAGKGETNILAMMVSSGDPWSGPCLDALNTWFGRPNIPIGVIKGESVRHESKYTRIIAETYPHSIKSNIDTPDAVQLYREILLAQPDNSVTIITVGYLTNLSNLLLSIPDANSVLDGLSLVKKKVARLVCMGGQYPEGREWNFYQDAVAAKSVVESWPSPIVFCGYEAGRHILTGAGLKMVKLENPVRQSYELYNGLTNRSSWDQITVLYAIRSGNEEFEFWTTKSGRNSLKVDGYNVWRREAEKSPEQHYLVQNGESADISDYIEKLMIFQTQ